MHAVISAPSAVLVDERALPAINPAVYTDPPAPDFIAWRYPSRNTAAIYCSIDVAGGPVCVTVEVAGRPAMIQDGVLVPVPDADTWQGRLLVALFKAYDAQFFDATHLAGTLHGLARLPVQLAS